MMQSLSPSELWAKLDYEDSKSTMDVLHLWSQIVGKIRLHFTPWKNHSWHVALYVTPRGLSTSAIPYPKGLFDLELDLVGERLHLRTSGGLVDELPLRGGSIADFYLATMEMLKKAGIDLTIETRPNEIADAIPFPDDVAIRAYNADAARRLHSAWMGASTVLGHFRTGFTGKASPVHLFWGSFDLSLTLYSGRKSRVPAPEFPGLPQSVARDAMSDEEYACGFWPGDPRYVRAAFYAYASPPPEGFADAIVAPADASFHQNLGEFILDYEVVRSASDPASKLMSFLESTYAATAEKGGWDRAALECPRGTPGVVRPVAPTTS